MTTVTLYKCGARECGSQEFTLGGREAEGQGVEVVFILCSACGAIAGAVSRNAIGAEFYSLKPIPEAKAADARPVLRVINGGK